MSFLKRASEFVVDFHNQLNEEKIKLWHAGTESYSPSTMSETASDIVFDELFATLSHYMAVDPEADGESIAKPFFLVNRKDIKNVDLDEDVSIIASDEKQYKIIGYSEDIIKATVKLWVEDV